MTHLTEENLNEYLDDALTPSARADVDAHLATCAACQIELDALRSLFATIESLPEAALERDLSAAVLVRLPIRVSMPRPVRWALAVQTLAVLASLVLILPLLDLSALQLPIVSLDLPSLPSLAQFVDSSSLRLRAFRLPSFTSAFSPPLNPPALLLILTLVSACLLWLVGNGLLLVLPRTASLKRRHS